MRAEAQEIDSTAATDIHPNDPHVETPGGVRRISVPPDARALSTLSRIDHEDAFPVEVGPAHRNRTPERWARAILEDAPASVRRTLRSGWLALGLRPGPPRSDRSVLGWEVRRSTPTRCSSARARGSGCRPNCS